MAKAPQAFETLSDTYSVTGVIGEGGSGRVFVVKDTCGGGVRTQMPVSALKYHTKEKEIQERGRGTGGHRGRSPSFPLILRHIDAYVIIPLDGLCSQVYQIPGASRKQAETGKRGVAAWFRLHRTIDPDAMKTRTASGGS